MKKRKKRDSVKYPALEKHYISRIKQEYMDYDYLNKLTDEEKDWLNRFTEEELNANFKHKGKKLIKTPEGKKASFHRNNARNRCVYSQAKAKNAVIDVNFVYDVTKPIELDEDMIIDLLDKVEGFEDTSEES